LQLLQAGAAGTQQVAGAGAQYLGAHVAGAQQVAGAGQQ
jgi:hypothetical protein